MLDALKNLGSRLLNLYGEWEKVWPILVLAYRIQDEGRPTFAGYRAVRKPLNRLTAL